MPSAAGSPKRHRRRPGRPQSGVTGGGWVLTAGINGGRAASGRARQFLRILPLRRIRTTPPPEGSGGGVSDENGRGRTTGGFGTGR